MALVLTEDRGAVRHLVLNRPEKRNALNGDLIRELGGLRRGRGGRRLGPGGGRARRGALFSSGMDLNDLRELSENPDNVRAGRRQILAAWNLLEEMPKPTICQIHGAALGGAFELALACDFRTMAEDAMAGIMEVRVGLLPDLGGCSRLPSIVGLGNAKELIMTGKVIDGREAHRIGFANRIAPADSLDELTEAFTKSCWRARRGRSGSRSASWTPRRSRPSRARSSRRSPRRRHWRRTKTSPRAPGPSSRSATRSSRAASTSGPTPPNDSIEGGPPGGRDPGVFRHETYHPVRCSTFNAVVRRRAVGRPG